MISKIKGKLVDRTDSKVLVETGGLTYQILIPKTVSLRLDDYIKNGEAEFIIYHFFQTEEHKFYPILVGFLTELEREFFEKIIKVAGIGPRAALKALNRPISEIAQAIEEADIQYLKNLPGIGLQRAKNIIAFLQGKVGRFILIKDKVEESPPSKDKIQKELFEEAEKVLLQLQYKKKEAKEMITKAFKANPDIQNLEELLNQIYRQRN
ncbi:MAG TPA: hypothetical protein ENI31_04355 [Candidatus Omnitrophica bacterium]|nr:MAG: hypothetical protein DRP80_03780 [Candidatus Omnitrophota bacterium]HEC69494.1 hypothetical protein [Candidatus Omnitrophota bacterium]